MMEITKIISMYLKTAYVTTDREKMLLQRVDYDWTGFLSLSKLYEEVGKLTRRAREIGEIMGVLHIDVKNMYRINTAYSRGTGDHIIDAIIELLEKHDSNRSIVGHVDGTCNFIILFRTASKDGIAEIVENHMTEICKPFEEYTNPPVILKAGLAFFKPGDYVVDYIDAAADIKKGVDFDRCKCVIAENVKTQYKDKNTYQTHDRRKLK